MRFFWYKNVVFSARVKFDSIWLSDFENEDTLIAHIDYFEGKKVAFLLPLGQQVHRPFRHPQKSPQRVGQLRRSHHRPRSRPHPRIRQKNYQQHLWTLQIWRQANLQTFQGSLGKPSSCARTTTPSMGRGVLCHRYVLSSTFHLQQVSLLFEWSARDHIF